ncbi:MAG: hypothetical protein NT029_17270 [Armatimonadetes bacterium]|nr:hypothetical protein [Armatimonadota bacterium]
MQHQRRRLLLAGAALSLVIAAGGSACGATDGASASATVTGLTGLIRIPTAHLLPSDLWRLQYTPPMAYPDDSVGATCASTVSFSLLPRTEFSCSMGTHGQAMDLTFHAKVQFLAPAPGRVGYAMGIADAGRTHGKQGGTRFAVATLPLAQGRLLVTGGLANGTTQGIVGGASYRLSPTVDLQTEFDTRRVNTGIVLRAGDWGLFRLADTSGGLMATTAVQLPLEYPAALHADAVAGARASVAAGGSATTGAQAALVAEGFEDVRVRLVETPGGRAIVVSYENRRYTLNQKDGADVGLAILARYAPGDVRAAAVELTQRGLVVARAQRAGAETSIETLPGRLEGTESEGTALTNPSVGHADLAIGVGLRTQVGSDYGAFRAGALALPEGTVTLGRGLAANLRLSYPTVGDLVNDEPNRFKTDRAVLLYAFAPAKGWLAQVSAGRYPTQSDGAVLEVARPVSASGLVRIVGGRAENDRLQTRAYLLGEYWHWLPGSPVQVRLVGGRFLTNDKGWGIDVIRHWGDVRVGMGYRDTSRSSVARISVSLPLGPRRQPQRPSALRVRLADTFDHAVRSIVGEEKNYLYLLDQTAGELQIGQDLVTTFFDRGRLLPGSGLWGK